MVTCFPWFAFVFLGARWSSACRHSVQLARGLSAVTAAVVGGVANLTLWFGLHVLFSQTIPIHGFNVSFDAPILGTINVWALGIAAITAAVLFQLRLGVIATLSIFSGAAVLLHFSFGVA